MENEGLKFSARHSVNARVHNDHTSAQELAFGPRVLRTRPGLAPGRRYKLIVEGIGTVNIFVTQNTESFVPQTKITLDKDTYNTHVYRMHIKDGRFMSDSGSNDLPTEKHACSERSSYYNLYLEEDSKPGQGHTRQMRVVENDTEKPWSLLLNIEGNISLITMVTEGGGEEDQLTFIDDAESCQSELFSADKSTFRRNIEYTSVCFGSKLLQTDDEIKLSVTRTKSDAVCKVGVMSDEHFKRLASSRQCVGYKEVSKHLTQPVLMNNILHEPTISQILVSIPMAAPGYPVFMFSGCALDLCTDITSRSLSGETYLKERYGNTTGVGEQLEQVQKTLACLELKISQKENKDNEHMATMLDHMKTAQNEAKSQSTSLSELRDQQSEMITEIKSTRGAVEKTSGHVKTISSRINRGLNRNAANERGDRSLEMLSKYISPNYASIRNSLCEKELMDYLLQYGVLTQQQQEDIRKQNEGGERRRNLLDVLCKKPVSHLPSVKEALMKSGNRHLLSYFEEKQ